MVIEKFENKQIGSQAVSNAVSVTEMRPALPTASLNVTPSDSPPAIDRSPPTEMISDSSSASVRSSSTRLLASSLTSASRTRRDQGGTDRQGTHQHSGLLRNPPHDDYSCLSQQLDSYSSFLFHQT